jgi:hypothetical protein
MEICPVSIQTIMKGIILNIIISCPPLDYLIINQTHFSLKNMEISTLVRSTDDNHHTPGPWDWNDNLYESDRIVEILHDKDEHGTEPIADVHKISDHNQTFANAKLIAAAPDLLEALYSALNLEMAVEFAVKEIPVCKGLDSSYHFDKIRKAIKLATD